jgi:hypothetical protein
MTGQKLDGVLSADVVALGDMLTASGQSVTLPDGDVLNGKQLTQFALRGVYEKFPAAAQTQERKEFQESVAKAALEVLTQAPNPQPLIQSLAKSVDQRRVMLYTTNAGVEADLLTRTIGGSLKSAEGPNVLFAAINVSGSKLDAWLDQKATYEVGRCPSSDQMVRSQVNVTLNNNIPAGATIPQYMVGMAEKSPEGPVNRVLAQFHLPVGAQVSAVTVDGLPASYVPFTEQGRTSLYVDVSLQPRKPIEIQVFFLEPDSGKPAALVLQPLGSDPTPKVIERPC